MGKKILVSLVSILTITTFTLFSCSSKPNPTPTPKNYLGVNFNEKLESIDYNNLARTKTNWVRGFLEFFTYYNDETLLETDGRISKYLTLKDHNYKTIINIKWNFSQKNFPDINSPEMNDYLKFLKEKIYSRIWDKTTILVIGNEPFIEYDKNDPTKKAAIEQQLVGFYSKVADETIKYRQTQTKKIPIYVGAFNNLYIKDWQTIGTTNLLNYVKNNSEIAGIDLHIHHSNIDEVSEVLNYITPKINPSQRIIVTEFSLKKHFQSTLGERISNDFLTKYNKPEYAKFKINLDYLNYIFQHGTDQEVGHPISKAEWYDYLKMSNWFESKKMYLKDMFTILKTCPNFYLATYAFQQGFAANKVIDTKTEPWFFNGLYANMSIVKNTSGAPEFNYAWIDSFWKIQAETSASK